MMPNLGGVFFPLRTRWWLYMTLFDGFGIFLVHMLLTPSQTVNTPKNGLMWPFNFESDSLHLNLINNFQFYGNNSFVNRWNTLLQSFRLWKVCGLSDMVMKWKISEDSLTGSLMKAMFTYQSDLANVVRLASNFSQHEYMTVWFTSIWLKCRKIESFLPHDWNMKHRCWPCLTSKCEGLGIENWKSKIEMHLGVNGWWAALGIPTLNMQWTAARLARTESEC